MGLSDFWLQFNNGKKEQLSDFKGDIRRETIDKKYQSIFDAFDFNGNGALEQEERSIFEHIISSLAEDKTLDEAEGNLFLYCTEAENSENIKFIDFVKNIVDANNKIQSTNESQLPDGSRKVVINYTWGEKLTAVYYPDGGLKYTVRETNPIYEGYPEQKLNTAVEFSERAKKDLRLSFGEYWEEVSENIIALVNSFEGDGVLTKGDATIFDRAGVNIRKALKDFSFTELFNNKGMETLQEYKRQAQENLKSAKKYREMAAKQPGALEFHLENTFGMKNTVYAKLENFTQTKIKYANAKSLKQRIELLNKGIKEVKKLYSNAVAKRNGVPNSDKLNSDYDKKFMEVLTEYFNGDQQLALAFFETMKEGINTGTKKQNEENNIILKIIDNIQKATTKSYQDILQGETFEKLEARYKQEFKDTYGKEDNTTNIEDLIQTGQEIGGTVKLGAMTVAAILLNAWTVGTGNTALIAVMNSPFTKYLSTVGTDYSLSVLGALTSQTGLNADKHKQILQNTIERAKFIGVGSLSSPLCKVIGTNLAKFTGNCFNNGVVKTAGNITTTTATGKNIVKNFCTKAADVFGNVSTEFGVFTGYEVITQDEDFIEAGLSQGKMLSTIKIMNKFLQTLLGRYIQTQSIKGQQKIAEKQYKQLLKETGLENATITKHESPTGIKYTGEINGIKISGNTQEEVMGKLFFIASMTFNKKAVSTEEKTEAKAEEIAGRETENKSTGEIGFEQKENPVLKKNGATDTKTNVNEVNTEVKKTSIPEGIRGKRVIDTKLEEKVERDVRIEHLNNYEKINSAKGKNIDKMIFDLLKDINNNSEIDARKIEEIRREIKLLAQTNPEEAANLELVLDGRTTTKLCSEATREEIAAIVQHLRRQFESEKNDITSWLKRMGAEEFGEFTERIKGDMSEFDKIVNYALKNPDAPFEMAIRDVRDNYGGRIELPSIDMKKVLPEVQKLVNEGKYDEAANLAVQGSVGKVFDFMKNIICDTQKFATIERVSNYTDSSNISLLDKLMMEKLQILAQKEGMPIVVEKWKIKQQDSGYQAFQVNLRTNTGKVFEIQIRFAEVGKYAEFEHYLYDIVTGKDIIGRKDGLEELFAPLKKILETDLTKEEYEKYYVPYTRAQYHYRFLKALGIDIPEPKLEDFPPPPGKTFDPHLKAENLLKLHQLEKKVKAKELTPDQAVEEWDKFVQENSHLYISPKII